MPLLIAMFFLPAHADDYLAVAQLTRDGKFNDALNKADAYLAAKPKDPQMRFLKGVAQKEAGKTGDAISSFTKLTEDYPELPEPYNNLAVLYASQNQFDKAKSALEMALKTNPGYAVAYDNLGDVYAKLSSQAYNKALQLDGNNASVPPKLALIRQLFNSGNGRVAPLPVINNTPPEKPAIVAAATNTANTANTAKPATPTTPAANANAPAISSGNISSNSPANTANPAKPKPESKPEVKTEADAKDQKDVQVFVKNWASAWADKDMKNYLGSYAKDFEVPKGQSRAKWEEERRARIVGKSKISVRIDNLKITINGSKATAKFRQAYKADGIVANSSKSLELSRKGDRWHIVKESVGS